MSMIIRYILLLCCVMYATCLYSSFWFPPAQFYSTVEAPFAENAAQAQAEREAYRASRGYRGERLIAALGNGEYAPHNNQPHAQNVYGDVKVYYKYNGNNQQEIQY